MDNYSERRVVSSLVHYGRKMPTLEYVLACNEKRKAPFPVEQVRRLWPQALQAIRNADQINQVMQTYFVGMRPDATPEQRAAAEALQGLRVCDVSGCHWPHELESENVPG